MTTRLSKIQSSDFTGGLNTSNPSSELFLNESPDLNNIVLMNRGFKKRRGDSAFCSAMNSGANVQGIGFYQPISGVKYLMAICGDKIFKSDALDGTMDDITGSVTITAAQNNIWTHSVMNDLSIFVGGAPDAPLKWSGSGNAAALGGSPASCHFGFQTRDRMFIGRTAANPSILYWSILSNAEDWSGTGSGNTTVETNDGDVLIGGIPLNNDLVILFKRYSIHQMITVTAPFPVKPLIKGLGCAGKLAMCNVNGLIYFVSNEPRLYVMNGYTAELVDPFGKIDNLWDGLNKSRLEYINLVHDKVRNLLVCYASNTTSTTNNYAIVWDLTRKCWLQFTTGHKANVACIVDGYRHFAGAYDGIVYERDKSNTFADASETAPGAINAYWNTAWLKGETNDTVIHPYSATINFATQTQGNIKLSYGFNYSASMKEVTFTQVEPGGRWDVDTWDGSFTWGGQNDFQKMSFIYGRGNNFQMKIFNDTVNEQMEINSYALMLKKNDVKEITAV